MRVEGPFRDRGLGGDILHRGRGDAPLREKTDRGGEHPFPAAPPCPAYRFVTHTPKYTSAFTWRRWFGYGLSGKRKRVPKERA
ncbi:hypothetical protein GCM10017557_52090 [Streptomyces aurantiacus]|uniref:Uncharacterized protein n=1 Tax=Streptomyces aurantiacus TaxID=47760 RepID=A0A7G1P979_9ACTN|nr:hypothetical protein GCM10017557_52090 [Streptomyces aurantiacus]